MKTFQFSMHECIFVDNSELVSNDKAPLTESTNAIKFNDLPVFPYSYKVGATTSLGIFIFEILIPLMELKINFV